MKNDEAWKRAQKVMPGGVSSPVRAFKAVGGEPLFIARGYGSRLLDIDGREYIDYVGAWGPQILGHAHPEVVEAIRAAVGGSTAFGAPCERETILAEMIIAAIPSMEMVRFVNSGTEATMSALRLARGVTGRTKIIKFAGCYHGHSDGLLVKAGSGATTLGIPDSKGVPPSFAAETVIASFNDTAIDERDIAAVIVEPVAGNMGVVPPEKGFLESLRAFCDRSGALLIFDEVMTGFRVAHGSAQARFGVTPDITCLGKIIGGGLPVGAYGARREIMEWVAPAGPVYQAGTNSGNPIAMAAGIATLNNLTPDFYKRLESRASAFDQLNLEGARLQRVGSMMTLFFSEKPVRTYDDLEHVDASRYKKLHAHGLASGLYFPPSAFEAFFVSGAHTEEDIEQTIATLKKVT